MAIGGTAIGDGGGISIGAEETAYGTLSAAMVRQHPLTSSLVPTQELFAPKQLSVGLPATRDYKIGHGAGEVAIGWDYDRTVIATVMGNLGALTGDVYKCGGNTARDDASVSIQIDTGGHVMQYLGAVAQQARWSLVGNDIVSMAIAYMTRFGTKIGSLAGTNPDENDIRKGGDMTTITVGGSVLCVLSATIELVLPISGADRICLGGATHKQPVDLPLQMAKASLNVELSDATGNDTEDELDDFLAGTAIGDTVLGDFELVGCYATGDMPALSSGVTVFPLNLEAQYLNVTTTA